MRKSLRLLLAGLLFLFISPIVSRARGSTAMTQADGNITSLSQVIVSIYGTENGSQPDAAAAPQVTAGWLSRAS